MTSMDGRLGIAGAPRLQAEWPAPGWPEPRWPDAAWPELGEDVARPQTHKRLDRLVAVVTWVALAAIVGVAGWLRMWQLGAVGFNTDEAVYVGQAAAIANDPALEPFFPLFRAHPLLYQFMLAAVFSVTGIEDVAARTASVGVGLVTVWLVYLVGKLLYGRPVGVIAALFMAVMPYHVVVTRQVLLDGPMTLFATLALYAIAKFASTQQPAWLYASGAAMGLTFLAKETGAVLLGAIYAVLALSPSIAVRIRDLALSVGAFVGVIAAFPLALALAGAGSHSTAQQYLVWQLFRRPNHDGAFYLLTVPPAIGVFVLIAAVVGLWLTRREIDWRQRLLVAWIVVVVAFFQLWPVKGFQYLLPAAPAVAVLAALGVLKIARLLVRRRSSWRNGGDAAVVAEAALASMLVVAVAGSLALSSWPMVQPSSSPQLLAGAGGVPGGRETGNWIRDNTPTGAQLMTIGPSMANIIAFYGHRRAYGLSVSPNPLRRNPSYDPVNNPDLRIRSNELQYVVWDSYSAARSPFFAAKIFDYVDRYHGREVYTQTVPGTGGTPVPVIRVYEVRR